MIKFLLISALIMGSGIVIPRLYSDQILDIDTETLACVHIEAYQLLDNPIEWILIQNMVAKERNGSQISMNVYTFWGIKYALLDVTCHGSSQVIWRKWFGKGK